MEPLKELSLSDLASYGDPFALFRSDPIAFVDDGKRCNGITIGWGGLGVLWNKNVCTVYIHETRFSKGIFDNAEYFSVCVLPKEYRKAIDYYGTVSGRDEDKIEKGGLKVIKDLAPYAEESKLVIICKKIGQSEFDPAHVADHVKDWYAHSGVHTIYQGEIVKVLGR